MELKRCRKGSLFLCCDFSLTLSLNAVSFAEILSAKDMCCAAMVVGGEPDCLNVSFMSSWQRHC